jgi:AcrR family transcriptional regulator
MSPTSATRPGRRERRRHETHERIFRCALRLFAQRGYLETTVEDITEAADVAKGTFFNYFPTKEHLLVAYSQMQERKAMDFWASLPPGPHSLRETMPKMLMVIAEEPGSNPSLVRNMMGGNLLSAPARKMMRRRLVHFENNIAQFFSAAQKSGELRRDGNVRSMARHFLQNYFGSLLLWSLAPKGKLSDLLISNFELFWAGLGKEKLS